MNLFDLNPQEDDDWQLDIGHEAIDYPEGNNYIVPLFEKTQIKTHKGCEIFVGNYLITVGHVAITGALYPNYMPIIMMTTFELGMKALSMMVVGK